MSFTTSLLADLVLCLRFCSRLPLPVFAFERAPHDFAQFQRAVRLLPLAGALVGTLGAAVLTITAVAGFPPLIAAALTVGAAVVTTGALHEDGLADCADGLGGATREKKLDIMRDSAIGTYGAIALALTLYLRAASLAAITTKSLALAGLVLIAGAALSRAGALAPLALLPPARRDGAGFSAGRPRVATLATAVLLAVPFASAPLLDRADWLHALLALAAAAGAALAVTYAAHRRLGGATGDVAGAAQQMSELAFLLAYVP